MSHAPEEARGEKRKCIPCFCVWLPGILKVCLDILRAQAYWNSEWISTFICLECCKTFVCSGMFIFTCVQRFLDLDLVIFIKTYIDAKTLSIDHSALQFSHFNFLWLPGGSIYSENTVSFECQKTRLSRIWYLLILISFHSTDSTNIYSFL